LTGFLDLSKNLENLDSNNNKKIRRNKIQNSNPKDQAEVKRMKRMGKSDASMLEKHQ
jgi:hypothetical protein